MREAAAESPNGIKGRFCPSSLVAPVSLLIQFIAMSKGKLRSSSAHCAGGRGPGRQRLEWQVTAAQDGARLDRFLTSRLPFCSRRELDEDIARHEILVNGRPAAKGARVQTGDTVTACVHTRLEPSPALDISILSEDPTYLALDKPAGLPSVAVRLSDTQTVANYLAAAFPECLGVGSSGRDVGVLHRLDTVTSGVLLVARTAAVYAGLRAQFGRGSVYKEYLAVVEGQCRIRGRVRFDLAPHGRHRRLMRVVSPGRGSAAIAEYLPLRVEGGRTLLRVVIETGVRHQIRAHLASLGHPVWGDTLYGSRIESDRVLLHASVLGFDHPVTGHRTRVCSPPPRGFDSAAADSAV